jgi:hypothetical protein
MLLWWCKTRLLLAWSGRPTPPRAMTTSFPSAVAAVRTIAAAGGGRGVFATCDIEPGALILSEAPLLRLPPSYEPADPVVGVGGGRQGTARPRALPACLHGSGTPLMLIVASMKGFFPGSLSCCIGPQIECEQPSERAASPHWAGRPRPVATAFRDHQETRLFTPSTHAHLHPRPDSRSTAEGM